MKEILARIEQKVEKIDDHLASMDKTLVKQEANLEEHMRRTELLEEQHKHFETELEPINAHVNQVKGVIKLLAFIVPIIATIVTAYFKWS